MCCYTIHGSVRQKRKCHVQMPHDVLFPFSLSAVARSILVTMCMCAASAAAAIDAIAHVVANENIYITKYFPTKYTFYAHLGRNGICDVMELR